MSRIGKKPVELPSGVSASVSGQTIEVKGPKGAQSFTATDDVVLGEESDLLLLGARTLVGMNVQIDPVTKRLVDAGPMPLAAVG